MIDASTYDGYVACFLRCARQKKGLSIEDLSKISGVSKSNIYNIENQRGSATIHTMEKLCKALDVYLFE